MSEAGDLELDEISGADVNGESDSSFVLREGDLLGDESFEEGMILEEEVYSSGDDAPDPSLVHGTEAEPCLSDSESEQLNETNDDALTNTPSPKTQKRKYIPKKLTRKRQRNPDQWEKNVQKKKVNLGQAYTSSYTHKNVPARSMKRSCPPGCRRKCQDRIDDDARSIMFNKLWSIQDHSLKYEFLLRFVKEVPRKPGEFKKREFSRKFLLENVNREPIEVCQTMFLNTLGISMQFVSTACKKRRNGDIVMKDNRGSSEKRPREVPAEDVENVKKHIKSFPRIEAHYVRVDSRREYLDENLSISKMYRLYQEWAREQQLPAVKKHVYNDIFVNEFNISFFKPKKDECDTCASYKNATEQGRIDKQPDYDIHLENKTKSRDSKHADIASSRTDKNEYTACFDYQKVLNTPRTENSCLYYKRKLSVMNFTIYDCGLHKGYCYCYDENEANRGSNEVGSCLLDFIDKKAQEGKTKINFYCDNCGGQNKNKGVLSTLEYAAIKYGIQIKLTFLEPGHTQNEADSVHAAIERYAAKRKIFVPDEWYRIIEETKITGHPYEVIRITHNDIYDFKDLSSGLNWSVKVARETDDGKVRNVPQQIPIAKIKQVVVSSEFKHVLKYKTSFNEEFKTLVMRTRNDHVKVDRYTLRRAYTSVQGIPKLKKDDLLELCGSNLIPPQPASYHLFYQSIPVRLIPNTNENN